jgi:glycosyltransferase involved in cell wall biosynthesis
MFLSVVMAAYDEEAAIEAVILDHVRMLEGLGSRIQQWEVVCVDDASRDRTFEILLALSGREPRVRVVRNPTNLGIHGAYARCYREARGTHVFFTGSDGQWPPENLLPMLDRLLAGADLVVGVRGNRRQVYTIRRRIVSYCFNALPRILFGVTILDAGSVKIGIREIFQFDLISKSPYSDAERIIKAARKGYRIGFVPIRFVARKGGKATGASWKNVRASVLDMFRCLAVYGPR